MFENVKFSCVHVGLFLDDTLWLHDKWICVINGVETKYSTGIGHRRVNNSCRPKSGRKPKDQFNNVFHKVPQQTKANMEIYKDEVSECSIPLQPKLEDVLFSVVSDSYAHSLTFEQWCDDFGYDTDSRKAYNTYEECNKVYFDLIKMNVGTMDELSLYFEDY